MLLYRAHCHPQFKAKFGPRGVMHCFATNEEDPTVDPRFGKMGKQKCEDAGPMTKKRMETVDEEVTKATLDFMEKAHKAASLSWHGGTPPLCTYSRI